MNLKDALLGSTGLGGLPKLLISPTGDGIMDNLKPPAPTAEKIQNTLDLVKAKGIIKSLDAAAPERFADVIVAALKIEKHEVTDELVKRGKRLAYAYAFGAPEAILEKLAKGENITWSEVHPLLAEKDL